MVGLAAYRVMFEHSADGVLFHSPDGCVALANPAACAMLDLTAEQIGHLGLHGIVDGDDPRWTLALAERDRTGAAAGVARLRRGDGRFVELEMSSRTFRGEDGSPLVCSVLHDITGRQAIEREIEELSARLLQLSRVDDLTGFQNRRGLIAAGTQLLQFADRRGHALRVLFVDVGNVAELNERLGLQAGDAALQAVARALAVAFAKTDVLARIGGTQFLALALGLDGGACDDVVRRVRGHLATPETAEFVGGPVTVSFGWATRLPGDRTSLEDLMARADWAMLEARDAQEAAGRPHPG